MRRQGTSPWFPLVLLVACGRKGQPVICDGSACRTPDAAQDVDAPQPTESDGASGAAGSDASDAANATDGSGAAGANDCGFSGTGGVLAPPCPLPPPADKCHLETQEPCAPSGRCVWVVA